MVGKAGASSSAMRERLASVRNILAGAALILFGKPSVCALCGSQLPKEGAADSGIFGICPSCADKLADEMAWVCEICGMPVRPPLNVCPDCFRTYHSFDYQRSAGVYQGDLKEAVIRMKHRGERWLSRPLAGLMFRAAREFLPVDGLIPVPLDPGSQLERGYNQALDLAVSIGELSSVPVIDALKRQRRPLHQAQLGRNMRWENLKDSMDLKRDQSFWGARLLLVDDIATTGATLDEAARVLKKAGAAKVFCVTAARTVKP